MVVWSRKRSACVEKNMNLRIYCAHFLLGFVLIFGARVSFSVTTPGDVTAINNLYISLGSPVLPGWVASGGDPCGEAWQGVQCNNTDIMSITLNGANLGGELGDSLANFASIKSIDLSNNHIGASIPSSLPVTMQNLFLSANAFTGSIPSTLSSLTLLTAMSLNDNHLSGEIPDVFESLGGLINFDLSNNNLSGHLPPSMGNLSSLTTLRLQNNQLSGTLEILENSPLRDLNVENNLFSGPIPAKLLSIPNFRKDGNPFNSSTSTLPSPASPSTSPSTSAPAPPFFAREPSSSNTPAKQANGPSAAEGSKSGGKKSSTRRIIFISIAAVLSFIILVLALAIFLPTCIRRRDEDDRIRYDIGAYNGKRENHRDHRSSTQPPSHADKGMKEAVVKTNEDHQGEGRRLAAAVPKPQNEWEKNVQDDGIRSKREDQMIDINALDMYTMPPPPPPPSSPPPPPPLPTSDGSLKPTAGEEKVSVKPSPKIMNLSMSAKSFTIASLQQYTNSFSQDNLIGSGMLGNVYRAELPDGKLLAVKKLDSMASSQQKDIEFLQLVNNIDKIRHANVVELMGYCAEHSQRLLIYEYCSNGTLHDALHSDDELKKKLSWNSRIRIALGAARALEYLHEECQPPIVHRNFKSVNLLLDDDLSVHVSDCGLAPLITSGAASQLSGQLLTAYVYGAPEVESGNYTAQSDVYSFGVVMLELLTGRESHDRTRARGEQFLVRWAIPQLHDIDALARMVDPSIQGEYPAKSLSRFADIISRCVQSEPEFRPQMSEIVQDIMDMIRREASP